MFLKVHLYQTSGLRGAPEAPVEDEVAILAGRGVAMALKGLKHVRRDVDLSGRASGLRGTDQATADGPANRQAGSLDVLSLQPENFAPAESRERTEVNDGVGLWRVADSVEQIEDV